MAVFKVSEPRSQKTIHIAVMVDTQAILRNPAFTADNVIYMMDDNGKGNPPSTGEGGYELNTHCNPGDQINWHVFAINSNDSVIFTKFTSQGNVFGNKPPSGVASEYLATVAIVGNETYQVTILVAGTVSYTWDPFITSISARPS
jgi:hypothetical protein